jgi:hypothetical protein
MPDDRDVSLQTGRVRRWGIAAALLTAMASALGCGGKDTAQVSGRVAYKDGQPMKGLIRIIRFEPTTDTTATVQKAASSEIADDGSFQLYTRIPGDGVYLGRYAVTFTVLSGATGGQFLVKPEYTQAESTPYIVDVEGDMSGLTFEIERN